LLKSPIKYNATRSGGGRIFNEYTGFPKPAKIIYQQMPGGWAAYFIKDSKCQGIPGAGAAALQQSVQNMPPGNCS